MTTQKPDTYDIPDDALEMYPGNYYGSLTVIKWDNKYWWAVENWDGYHWQEITEELYNALKKFKEQPE